MMENYLSDRSEKNCDLGDHETRHFETELFETINLNDVICLDDVLVNGNSTSKSRLLSCETTSERSDESISNKSAKNKNQTADMVSSESDKPADAEIMEIRETSSDEGSSIFSSSVKSIPVAAKRGKVSKGSNKKRKEPRSHNAIMAKIAREKKKHYIKTLESDLMNLTEENKSLKKETSKMSKTIVNLTETVNYLNNVLKNESTLSKIITVVNNEQENIIRLRSNKRSVVNDHSYTQVCTADDIPNKKLKAFNEVSKKETPAGICLHVQDEGFSIEMCSTCNVKANKLLTPKTVSKK